MMHEELERFKLSRVVIKKEHLSKLKLSDVQLMIKLWSLRTPENHPQYEVMPV